jgi:hypothetical protein
MSVPAPVPERSPLGGYLGHDALLLFLRFFSKKIYIYVITDPTGERCFGGRLDLMRSKDDGLCGARCCCLFKVPSAYASVATTPRLASTARVLMPSSDLFSKAFEQPPRLWSKTIFTTVLGGCECVAPLRGPRGPSFSTPTPPRLQSTAWSSQTPKVYYTLLRSTLGGWERSSCNAL